MATSAETGHVTFNSLFGDLQEKWRKQKHNLRDNKRKYGLEQKMYFIQSLNKFNAHAVIDI